METDHFDQSRFILKDNHSSYWLSATFCLIGGVEIGVYGKLIGMKALNPPSKFALLLFDD